MFISGKEIVTIDNKNFMHISDAMQIIAPTATNAARWFKQHREDFTFEREFIYSDARYPGKTGRIWLTMPEGFQALYHACVNAPRLKIVEGVEERVAPFVEFGFRFPDISVDTNSATTTDDEVEIEFAEGKEALKPSIAYEEPQERLYGMSGFDTPSATQEELGMRNAECGEECGMRNAECGIKNNSEIRIPNSEGVGELHKPIGVGELRFKGYSEDSLVEVLEMCAFKFVDRYHVTMESMEQILRAGLVEMQGELIRMSELLHNNLIKSFVKEVVAELKAK